MNKKQMMFIIICGIIFGLFGCNTAPATPDFSAISSPEIPVAAQTEVAEPSLPPTATPSSPSADASTETPASNLFALTPTKVLPDETQTPTPTPEDTATPVPTETPLPTETATPIPEDTTDDGADETAATVAPTQPPVSSSPPDEPRKGESWDMEDGFDVWINPFGDNCSGSKVATGWNGFTSRGQFGSSCLYLNDYAPNVFSGRYSQLVTFDFVDAHAGLYRVLNTQPGHNYQVTARLRHVHTLPPMQFHFGVDLSGGNTWDADSVQWVSWDEFREDDWITHEETFTATGEKSTIYIKGFHDTASQGGATYIDAIEVIDLGG